MKIAKLLCLSLVAGACVTGGPASADERSQVKDALETWARSVSLGVTDKNGTEVGQAIDKARDALVKIHCNPAAKDHDSLPEYARGLLRSLMKSRSWPGIKDFRFVPYCSPLAGDKDRAKDNEKAKGKLSPKNTLPPEGRLAFSYPADFSFIRDYSVRWDLKPAATDAKTPGTKKP